MVSYFLLVLTTLIWMVFTLLMWYQGKQVDAAISAVIMNIYIAATVIVGAINSKE